MKLPATIVSEILSFKVCEKGWFETLKLIRESFLNEMVNNKCMQSLLSISALLLDLWIIDFLKLISILNQKCCFHAFSKNIHALSLRFHTMHIHIMVFYGKRVWCWSLKRLDICRSFLVVIGFVNCCFI